MPQIPERPTEANLVERWAILASLACLPTASLFCSWNRSKMNLAQRKDRVKQKKASFLAKQDA